MSWRHDVHHNIFMSQSQVTELNPNRDSNMKISEEHDDDIYEISLTINLYT